MNVKEVKMVNTKSETIEILNAYGIDYNITMCNGCERICITMGDKDDVCCEASITVQTCDKDIYRVYLHKILYIAIEDRKSVVYMTDNKIKTNYSIDYWKEKLNGDIFVQPHYSYIVNLNYVDEVTKDFVKIKYCGKEYTVYTSSRKIGAFKKAFLKFSKV